MGTSYILVAALGQLFGRSRGMSVPLVGPLVHP